VVRRHCHPALLGRDGQHVDVVERHRQPDEGHVAAAVSQTRRGVVPPHQPQGRDHTGCQLPEAGERPALEPAPDRRLHAHHDLPGHRHSAHRRHAAVPRLHRLAGRTDQRPPGLGQRHSAWQPLQQRDPDLSLERPQLLGQRRLRHEQALGGPGDAVLVGDGDQRPEVPKVHVHAWTVCPPGMAAGLGQQSRPGAAWAQCTDARTAPTTRPP
jgi:hypothetical protein